MSHTTFLAEHSELFAGDAIEHFVRSQGFPAAIKDAETGCYLACNEHVSSLAGLKPEEYVGLTAYDIRDRLDPWDPEVIENAIRMDRQIIHKVTDFVKYPHVWLTKDKSIFIEEVVKKPILGKDKQIVAILAYGYELTSLVDPEYLFSLYEFYHTPLEAIARFLKHIKLDKVFVELLPNREELMVLLNMRKTTQESDLAVLLKSTPQTIKNYQARLREKLQFIGLDEVLIYLSHHEELSGEDIP